MKIKIGDTWFDGSQCPIAVNFTRDEVLWMLQTMDESQRQSIVRFVFNHAELSELEVTEWATDKRKLANV